MDWLWALLLVLAGNIALFVLLVFAARSIRALRSHKRWRSRHGGSN